MENTQSVTARAIVSYGPYSKGGWKLRNNLTLRPLRDNELLVELVASGICQTDLHFADMDEGFGAHYPRVMGHEVPDTSARSDQKPPRRKSTTPSFYPSHPARPASAVAETIPLTATTTTRSTSCPARRTRCSLTRRQVKAHTMSQPSSANSSASPVFPAWSIVREESVINMTGLVENREELQLLAPLGCGLQTGVGAVMHAAQARPGDRVAVLGAGGVGLSAVLGAVIAGCEQIIVIARNEARLKLALDLGATDVIQINLAEDLECVTDAVRRVTGGLGANITLDTTGAPALIAEAVRMTAFKGTILQLGVAPITSTLALPIHEFMVSGKRFQGVVEGDVDPQKFIPMMVGWVKRGLLPLQKMVGFYQPEDFENAIRDMQGGKAIKPVLLW